MCGLVAIMRHVCSTPVLHAQRRYSLECGACRSGLELRVLGPLGGRLGQHHVYLVLQPRRLHVGHRVGLRAEAAAWRMQCARGHDTAGTAPDELTTGTRASCACSAATVETKGTCVVTHSEDSMRTHPPQRASWWQQEFQTWLEEAWPVAQNVAAERAGHCGGGSFRFVASLISVNDVCK
jgi:hypothetical protein